MRPDFGPTFKKLREKKGRDDVDDDAAEWNGSGSVPSGAKRRSVLPSGLGIARDSVFMRG